jgi:uncharacterized protein YjiS (DUF1127 family)
MTAHYPVLPIAAGASLRACGAILAFVVYWAKQMARAHRHRREATVLAGLDRRMLADIGITRSDVHDAFSEPFWEDPTALLRERALERRWNRALLRDEIAGKRCTGEDFHRPPTDRPARQTV